MRDVIEAMARETHYSWCRRHGVRERWGSMSDAGRDVHRDHSRRQLRAALEALRGRTDPKTNTPQPAAVTAYIDAAIAEIGGSYA